MQVIALCLRSWYCKAACDSDLACQLARCCMIIQPSKDCVVASAGHAKYDRVVPGISTLIGTFKSASRHHLSSHQILYPASGRFDR